MICILFMLLKYVMYVMYACHVCYVCCLCMLSGIYPSNFEVRYTAQKLNLTIEF